MRYAITHIPTGETQIYEDDGDYNWEWAWTEGNASCDCNRFLYFERAGGNSPSLEDCPPCGDDVLYSVEFITEEEGACFFCSDPDCNNECI